MIKKKAPYNHFDYLINTDEVINERLDSSSFMKMAKQFMPRQADIDRNNAYMKYFNRPLFKLIKKN